MFWVLGCKGYYFTKKQGSSVKEIVGFFNLPIFLNKDIMNVRERDTGAGRPTVGWSRKVREEGEKEIRKQLGHLSLERDRAICKK